VRGLDYYTRTVFEIAPEGETGAQVALGGGGRYDNLIEQLGGKPTPAVGFATGIERLALNLKKQDVSIPASPSPTVFVAYLGKDAKGEAIRLTAHLRKSGISALASINERSLKAQLKQANVSGVRYAVIIGEDEVKSKSVVLRNMAKGEQQVIPIDKLAEALM
jgi:histidyl-tRNA synthetase